LNKTASATPGKLSPPPQGVLSGMFRMAPILLVATVLNLQAQPEISRGATVITHATIIDGTGNNAQSDMTLVIEGRTIRSLGKHDGVNIPANARVIEAKGKFIIPGLWDMHVHLSFTKASALPALVANGVTGSETWAVCCGSWMNGGLR
jgi:hypothetical protein